MQIDIQARGFELNDTLRDHIETRLRSSFEFTQRKIHKVVVRLFNTTSAHRRNIKSCRVQAVVVGLPNVITEYRGKNFYLAADTAIQRANRSVSKRLRRLRKLRSNPRSLPQVPAGSFA